jgi:hypothetical protein
MAWLDEGNAKPKQSLRRSSSRTVLEVAENAFRKHLQQQNFGVQPTF